jgi:hypothetical protein
MNTTMKHRWTTRLVVGAALLVSPMAQADVVTDWNITATDIAVAVNLPPPPTYWVMTLVQSAVYEAVNAITKRYPADRVNLDAAPGASVDAAVAAANRAMLSKLLPLQQAAIPRVSMRALHRLWRGRYGAASGNRDWPHADLDDDQLHRPRRGAKLDEDRRLHAGGSERAHLRRRPLPHLHGSGDGDGEKDWPARGGEILPAAQVARAGDTIMIRWPNLAMTQFVTIDSFLFPSYKKDEELHRLCRLQQCWKNSLPNCVSRLSA